MIVRLDEVVGASVFLQTAADARESSRVVTIGPACR